QLTTSPKGVYDFDTSPDGRTIVFTERDPQTFHADLYLLDVDSNRITPLTNCKEEDSDCFAPSFNPNGQFISYERVPLNSDIGTGIGNPRIWLIDMSTQPARNIPLIS
ncbi:MAG TPA: hypothetical protein PLZ51_00260, partial [Aggregatilineales bacterium]|nr:hypothetical protein [Aggregatilineales bacterium]